MCRRAEGSGSASPFSLSSIGAYGPNSCSQALRQESLPAEPSSQRRLSLNCHFGYLCMSMCGCVGVCAGAGRSMQMSAEARKKHGCAADGAAGKW